MMPMSSSFNFAQHGPEARQGAAPHYASPGHHAGLLHSPVTGNINLDPDQTVRLEQQRADIRNDRLPSFLQVKNINKTSVTKKVDVKLLNKLAKFDGSHKPTLREWP